MALTKAQACVILTRLGFRVNTPYRYSQALRDFQSGWALGAALEVDGVKGPLTDRALLLSEARRARGLGTASKNFSFSEMACKCGGRYSECRRIWTPRSVFVSLEASRARVGHAISVTSGCRCLGHNKSVGGATNSMHLYGLAVDWTGPDKDVTKSWHIWRGIGYGGRSDRSLHTDLRPTGSVTSPVTWVYSGQ